MTSSSQHYYNLYQVNDDLFDRGEMVIRDVKIQGRVHHIRKQSNKLFFLILREKEKYLQCVIHRNNFPSENQDEFRKLLALPIESVIHILGDLVKTQLLIKTTNSHFELQVKQITMVSSADASNLPFQTVVLNEYGDDIQNDRHGKPNIGRALRFDHRVLDLRSAPNQLLFRLRGQMEHYIRQFLLGRSFTEIHTPKISSIPSESGSDVFQIGYFDRNAFLTQSPQLYKQMCINADFKRCFEIGAVYRAEKSVSHRHLCEFIGLDLEMELDSNMSGEPSYHQVLNVIENMFFFLKNKLENSEHQQDRELLRLYFPGDDPLIPLKFPVISFEEAIRLLQSHRDFSIEDQNQDLTHEAEMALGRIVREIFKSDIFVIEKYPKHLRPFYTFVEEDGRTTRSYDIIFRGCEIASGAQRVNNYEDLKKNMSDSGLTLEYYMDYIESFRYGSPPHAGAGIGLERLIGLYLNIPDIHMTSLFPRHPSRLTP